MIEITELADKITAILTGQLRLWAGLAVCVLGALLTSSDLLPDGPTKHTLQVAFTVATAVNAYFLQRPKE